MTYPHLLTRLAGRAHPSLVTLELARRDPVREAFDLAGKVLIGHRQGRELGWGGRPRLSDPAFRPGCGHDRNLPFSACQACIDPFLTARSRAAGSGALRNAKTKNITGGRSGSLEAAHSIAQASSHRHVLNNPQELKWKDLLWQLTLLQAWV
jgi:hypothetical protein